MKTMTENVNIDAKLRKLCRVCLSKEKCTVDIFNGTCADNEHTYYEILLKYVDVHISKDSRLSSIICYTCVAFLTSFISFRKQCIQSEITLANILKEQEHVVKEERPAARNFGTYISLREHDDCKSDSEDIDSQNTSDSPGLSNSRKINTVIPHVDSDVGTYEKSKNSTGTTTETKSYEIPNQIEIKSEPDDPEVVASSTETKSAEHHERFSEQDIGTYITLQESIEIKNECESINSQYTGSDVSISNNIDAFENVNNFLTNTIDENSQYLERDDEENVFRPKVCRDESIKTNSTPGSKKPFEYQAYECDLCSRVFNKKVTLAVHKSVHSFEKSLCNMYKKPKRNSRACLLTRDGRKKAYACFLCNKSFSTINTLHIHLRIHKLCAS